MSVAWGVVTQVGFWGWLLLAIIFILSVFPHRDSFRSDRAFRWGIPLILLYLVWVVGMLNA
jgi:hypothetical protein